MACSRSVTALISAEPWLLRYTRYSDSGPTKASMAGLALAAASDDAVGVTCSVPRGLLSKPQVIV
ncbi:hypothetical protein D3C76_1826250 [compost metagenome]